MKVCNKNLKNRKLMTSYGEVQFDSDGVADVQPDEYAEALLQLKGYEAVEGVPEKEEQPEEQTPVAEEEQKPEQAETTSPEEVKEQDGQSTQPEEQPIIPEVKEDEEEQKPSLEDELDKLNVPQLKKYAKDNQIDLAGAAKKDEIISVILGASK